MSMQSFLQGRIDLVKALRKSSLPVTYQDLVLILSAVISACAACRWPGESFDRKRFVESLIRFGSAKLHLDYVSTGALLELGVISDSETPWGEFDQEIRIFTGGEIDGAIPDMAQRYPNVSTRDLKRASYANRIYEWLRCGYAHNYWAAGNTTHVAPSDLPAQISYIGRRESDGTRVREASFHLDYLISIAEEQVATPPESKLEKPDQWWIDQTLPGDAANRGPSLCLALEACEHQFPLARR
jgi:hypothetical protein